MLLCVVVHAVSISDSRGARLLLLRLHPQFTGFVKIFVDGGYKRGCIDRARTMFGWALEVVKRLDDGKGFKPLPRRWIVERSFASLGNDRLHARNDHHNPGHAETAIYTTSTRIMLRILARM